MKTRILVLGASGLVGKALINELQVDFEVYGTYNSKEIAIKPNNSYQFSVGDTNRLKEILVEVRPNIIISMLRGDYNHQLAVHKELAYYLNNINGRLYYGSTANVFDNSTDKPHTEKDEPNASSEYGIYKMNCEKLLKDILAEKCIILRLPMIMGKNEGRYINLKNDIEDNKEVTLYTNLFLNTNTDVMLAKQIHYIISKGLTGNFHLASNDLMTHSEFYYFLIKEMNVLNVKTIEKKISENDFYLALKSNRTDIPPELQFTNEDVIKYLVG